MCRVPSPWRESLHYCQRPCAHFSCRRTLCTAFTAVWTTKYCTQQTNDFPNTQEWRLSKHFVPWSFLLPLHSGSKLASASICLFLLCYLVVIDDVTATGLFTETLDRWLRWYVAKVKEKLDTKTRLQSVAHKLDTPATKWTGVLITIRQNDQQPQRFYCC